MGKDGISHGAPAEAGKVLIDSLFDEEGDVSGSSEAGRLLELLKLRETDCDGISGGMSPN